MAGMQNFDRWIGRSQTLEERLAPEPVEALAAILDVEERFAEGQPVPPMWHWLYFLPRVHQSELGTDGHPPRGTFMPPVDLPRRMFAGTRTRFHQPLILGEVVQRNATITTVQEKEGRSGPLLFVTVRYELRTADGRVAVIEEQDIVYRGQGAAGRPSEPNEVPAGSWTERFFPDPVVLFRFSAVTFNAHRIHYDRPYATAVEGYPNLVVQGPLLALRLLQACRANHPQSIGTYSFRAHAPVFVDDEVVLVGGAPTNGLIEAAAYSASGQLAMTAAVGASPEGDWENPKSRTARSEVADGDTTAKESGVM